MKVTTEKLPKSLLALNIELDRAQVEKGLDKAARRISQRANIPGFRRGKAPRFIVENYYGRAALLEEAHEDIVNQTFRDALKQENIEPIGQASLETVNFTEEPYHIRVTVPVAPTVTAPAYRDIRVPVEPEAVTDEMLEQAMSDRRERHVVLREPEEARPAQEGDQLTATLETFLDGEPLEPREEGQELEETDLVLEQGKLIDGLYEGLLGINVGDTRDIAVTMPEDHANEDVRGKEVIFQVVAKRIQERLLPEWEELSVLEEFEGSLDDLRARTREELERNARQGAERTAVDAYVRQIVEQTEFDLPDALIAQEADAMLEEQGRSFAQYGITLDQFLQYRGQTREEAAQEFLPQAEERLKTRLVLGEVIAQEGLTVDNDEVDDEIDRAVATYPEEQREMARNVLSTQMRSAAANNVLNQKLQERLLAIATGAAPELAQPAAEPAVAAESSAAPADEA